MKKILVLSDNELLNQLYSINFEIYLGAKTTIVRDINKTQDLFKDLEVFDAIVSMVMMNESEVGNFCYDQLKKQDLTIPLIILSSPIDNLENVIFVPSSYNLQNLLRVVAIELGVTAKNMSELSLPKFYPIGVKYLNHLQTTPCALFLQVKNGKGDYDYVLCANKDMAISALTSKLLSESVTNLYINSNERLLLVNKISLSLTQLISGSQGASLSEKSDVVSASFSFVASQMFESEEIVQEMIAIADGCAQVMEAVVSEVAGLKELVAMLLKNKDGYIYIHSMLVAYVAKHIVKNVTWGGDAHIDRLNFMIFFHDLYLVPIYQNHPEAKFEEDLLFSKILNDSEKEVVLHHARLAGEQIAKYKKCPSGVDLLIKQHHGMANGVGFATDFSDNISPLSKVFIISETFAEFYLKGKQADSNFKVNLKEYVEKMHIKFSKHTYRKIIDPLLTLKI